MGGQMEQHSPEVSDASVPKQAQALLQKLSRGTLLGLGLKSLLLKVWVGAPYASTKASVAVIEGGRGWEVGVSRCKLL